MDAENIKFDGAGKLTIASDGEHNIHIYGSLTANGPISVKYGETDLSAVPVTIGESGSVEFDFSASDFSSVNAPTNYQITGHTADYGSKVTGVYPSDIYHTYTLTHNGSTNSYILTVEPSVKWWQDHAIALVTPYYNGNHVGAGLGKYTISLGETSYANMKDFGDAVTAWATIGDCVEPTITLNTPAAGFYRLKNVATNEYLTAISGPYGYTSTTRGVYANGDANSAATVVRLYDKNSDGKLYMYNQGYGFGWTDANNVDGSGAVGYLSTNPDKDCERNSFRIGSEVTDHHGQEANADTEDDAVIAGTDYTADAAQWIVETATTATIPMHSDGADVPTYYATLCLPYDVTISNATAYTLAENGSGEWLIPTEVPDNEVPAGTPVLLKGSNETATATINTGAAFNGGSPLDCDLTGTYLATTIDGANDYVLGIDDGTGIVGFYHWNQNDLSANRAYIDTPAAPGVKGFKVLFNNTETGLERIVNVAANHREWFDLSGRRVKNPAKGLYIVNGKKVSVK